MRVQALFLSLFYFDKIMLKQMKRRFEALFQDGFFQRREKIKQRRKNSFQKKLKTKSSISCNINLTPPPPYNRAEADT